MEATLGVVGGTGAFGRGIAGRFAMTGCEVHIGSRDPQRAAATAEELADAVPMDTRLVGGSNADAAGQDVVILAVPFEGLEPVLDDIAGPAAGRIVVSAVSHLAFDAQGPYAQDEEAGSVAQHVAARLPEARLVAAFHTLPALRLRRWDADLDDDVLVAGDDDDAVRSVVELATQLPGCRGIAVGPLRTAASIEAFTPALLAVNRRNGVHAGVRLTGI